MNVYTVEVREKGSQKIVKKLGPMGDRRRAEKIKRAVDANLNHADFESKIVAQEVKAK